MPDSHRTGRHRIGSDLDRFIAPAAEPRAVPFRAAGGSDLCPALHLARVEGRIDVDQIDRCRGHGLQDREVVAEVDTMGHALCCSLTKARLRG